MLPAEAKAPPGPYLDAISEVIAAVRTVLGAATDGVLPPARGLDIAFRLHRYWAASNVAEGRFWLSRLVAGAPAGAAAAHATYALGYLGYWAGDTAAASRDLHAAAEQLAGQDDEYAARALIYLGGLADDLDRGDDALGYVRRAIAAAAPFGADLQVGAAIGMGCVLAERGSPEAAGFAAEAIALCRRAGSPEQLAATLPTAAMVCWQVGELDAARGYVTEAMPLLAGSRRIARVVLLSAAAGIALADGDRGGAAEFAGQADADARDLGIEREIPLIRCVLARARLASGDVTGAAAAAAAAIAAARALAFPYPMALCLETAALVLLDSAGLTAARRRVTGNSRGRPGSCSRRPSCSGTGATGPAPSTLSGDVTRARVAAARRTATALEPAAAAELGVALLAALSAAVGTDQPR